MFMKETKTYSANKQVARDYYSIASRYYASMLDDCKEHASLIRSSSLDIQEFYTKHGIVPAVKYLPRHAQNLLDFIVKKGKKAVEQHYKLEQESRNVLEEKRESPRRCETPSFVSLDTLDEDEDLSHLY